MKNCIFGSKKVFQSTPSVGRATKHIQSELLTRTISIHALRGEGDERTTTNYKKT